MAAAEYLDRKSSLSGIAAGSIEFLAEDEPRERLVRPIPKISASSSKNYIIYEP